MWHLHFHEYLTILKKHSYLLCQSMNYTSLGLDVVKQSEIQDSSGSGIVLPHVNQRLSAIASWEETCTE